MASQSFQLVMRTGPHPGKVFALNKNEMYIGRDINNEIVINDAEVSRKHARLLAQAGGYLLEDLGSTNGSFVNGQRLMGPHVLRPGEMIMFGENVSLAFELVYDADATVIGAPPPAATYTPPQPAAPQYQPQPMPAAQPVPQQAAQPRSAYTGQVPQGPAEPYYEPLQEERRDNRRLIIAGCVVLAVLACLLVAGAFAFDTLNLYCVPPFNALFGC
jgi:predicted component of type VI protein secretion system